MNIHKFLRRRLLPFFAYLTVASLSLLPSAAAGIPSLLPAQTTKTKSGFNEIAATFDLYSMHPTQILPPSGPKSETFLMAEARNITDVSGEVHLRTESETRLITTKVEPSKVLLNGKKSSAKVKVHVRRKGRLTDGKPCWIKLTGRRGNESHRIWLKVEVRASYPQVELSRGPVLRGHGYLEPKLVPYVGKLVRWHISVKNLGALEDTYPLKCETSIPCKTVFRNLQGKPVKSVTLPGRTRNLLFAKPRELMVDIMPLSSFKDTEEKRKVKVAITVGPGRHSSQRGRIELELFNPGLLYCANASNGLRPHAHQVMPGEKTTFLLHLSNTENVKTDVTISANGAPQQWDCKLDRSVLKNLKPGETKHVLLNLRAPRRSRPGEKAEVEITARSTSGRTEKAKVTAELTETRNIYFWAIDSMDPEYLYLSRKGTGRGRKGDWLMPNIRAFLRDSINYRNTDAYLPSATDMNHTNALAGTYTGTQGIYMVGGTYKGFTEHDEVLVVPNTMDLMKYGKEGKPIERVFEVAKEETSGKALCGFWSNKNWLAELEGGRGVDIIGHSERWPLFFKPPWKYRFAGDPKTDSNPEDPVSAPIRSCFHSPATGAKAVVIPTILGQFDIVTGLQLFSVPIALLFGKIPGMHAEDRYIASSFFRSIIEEDPDVCYINLGDLDNTGHFTGASWSLSEWKPGKTEDTSDDENVYSPWLRRDECIDIAREADALFGSFIRLLKERGVYENSIIVVLSDHGMENMKDPKKGYEVIDLREILRDKGIVFKEQYEESGGTELSMIWCPDLSLTARIEKILEKHTVCDPILGKVRPLIVVNRKEMRQGVEFGKHGRVRPMELYSEKWIENPSPEGHIWPDLFVFPLYNYQIMAHGDSITTGINNVGLTIGINAAEEVKFGFPAAHGGLQTQHIPLLFKPPDGCRAGYEVAQNVEIGDIAPTIYRLMGWKEPECVDGKPLPLKNRGD